MPIEIRLLQSEDTAVLTHVAPDVFDDPVVPNVAAAFLADPHHHLAVALDEGVVVGFASGVDYLHPDKPRPEFWINEVGTAASYRGRGIGKAIVSCLLDAARALGCSEAWVLTERDNRAAMALYRATGGDEAASASVMFTFRLDEPA